MNDDDAVSRKKINKSTVNYMRERSFRERDAKLDKGHTTLHQQLCLYKTSLTHPFFFYTYLFINIRTYIIDQQIYI